VPKNNTIASPGPLFGKAVGVGVGVGEGVVFFAPPEDELGGGVGVGLEYAGVLVDGLGEGAEAPCFTSLGAMVVGAGPELFETLWYIQRPAKTTSAATTSAKTM
jgi:hypothetical protein